MKSVLYASLLTGASLLVPHLALAQDILSDPTVTQLSDQNIDANQAFLEALRRAAERGPVFQFAPDRLVIDLETGETGRATVRVSNTGDQPGVIEGVNLVGSVPGLDMTSSCDGEVRQGDFCEIEIEYTSPRARDVNSAIVGSVTEKARRNFEIPLSITVQDPPPPPPPTVQEPIAVAPVTPPASTGPMPRDVAREYFAAMSPMARGMNSPRGFTRVRAAADPAQTSDVAGVRYGDIRIETVREDERYDPAIPYTDASLPVNRDRILTADRVIKAVLETPVSNVMCNKVVAMVESDVYSATSAVPLIQSGSRVIGECQQFVDERVGIAWSRIITTDGRSISFQDRMADTNDATGLGGAIGRVYMSPFDKYVLPIFSTMIDTAAGVIFAAFGDDEQAITDENGNVIRDNSARNEGLRIVTGEARGTAQQIIRDIRDVREIAVIPKGSRIDIEILEDIYFREDRRVVTLADMRFDLEDIQVGAAERDLPQNLVLVPVSPGYQGATVAIGGRSYRLEEAAAEETPRNGPAAARDAPDPSRQTLDELAATPNGG